MTKAPKVTQMAYRNTGIAFRFVSNSDSNTLNGNRANNNTDDGFYFEFSDNEILANNSALTDSNYAFLLNGSNYDTLSGNNATECGVAGFRVDNSSYNDLDGNIGAGQNETGFILINGAEMNNLTGNTANDGFSNGFTIVRSTLNTLTNNTAYNNSGMGFRLTANSDSNVLVNNSAHDNTGYGFALNQSGSENLSGNTAYEEQGGFDIILSDNDDLSSNSALNNEEYGIVLNGSDYGNLSGNSAIHNHVAGFRVENSTHNDLASNIAYSQVQSNFLLVSGSDMNTLTGNTAHDGSANGFTVVDSILNNFTSNVAYKNNGTGFRFVSVSGSSVLISNRASNNSGDGFYFELSDDENLTNNSAQTDSGYGFLLNDSSHDILSDNTAYGSPAGGLSIFNANATNISADHYYGNGVDLVANSTGASDSVILTGVIFDNPAGNLTHFTNLTLNATLASDGFEVSWSPQPSSPPNPSFAQKFVNISGTAPIHYMAMSWLESELTGYDKTKFQLWDYNGTWSQMPATLNTVTDKISLTNFNPSGVYGILQPNASSALNVTLNAPALGSTASKRLITFNCSANSSVGLSNVTLYANFSGSWQANQTDTVSGTFNSTSFAINLPYDKYSWNCLAYDTNGDSAWAPANYTFTADSLPIYSDFSGSTTDFTAEADLENVSTPILENTTFGKLQWNGDDLNVSGANFNAYVLFGLGSVSVNSGHLSPTLDSSANITLYGLPYQYTPAVYSDGALCTNCDILYYTNHDLAFTVPHFTNYSVGPNSELAIYSEFEGGSIVNQTPITFYANYTNVTNGAHIAGATCLISFDDATSGTMTDSGTQYNYIRVTPFSTPGSHPWNVTCSQVWFETLNATDNLASGNTVSLAGASISNQTTMPRWGGNSSGNLTIAGGNISNADLNSTTLTGRWAALFGNVSGSVLLGDDASHIVYTWGWNASNGGIVCASTNSTLSSFLAFPGYSSEIDNAWGFSGMAGDSANNTFTGRNCSMDYGPTTISGADYADTGVPGGFETCAFKSYTTPDKAGLLFCSDIINGGQLYNGQSGDFEMIVPTTPGTNPETYYLYMSVN